LDFVSSGENRCSRPPRHEHGQKHFRREASAKELAAKGGELNQAQMSGSILANEFVGHGKDKEVKIPTL
jgi:hypothetical protein